LSRVMDEEKLKVLTEICGTPGYMAPEIFRKTGHGKPVDVWAMGVITYFLLCGYTPFDRENQQQEMEAILAGEYHFEPKEYWQNVSEAARDFVRLCLTNDPAHRPTAKEALEHRWLASTVPHFVADPESASGGPKDLLPHIREKFNARKTFRKAVLSMVAMKRLAHTHTPSPRSQLALNVDQYKKDAEDEHVDESHNLLHAHLDNDGNHSRSSSIAGTPTAPGFSPPLGSDQHAVNHRAADGPEPPTSQMASAKLDE